MSEWISVKDDLPEDHAYRPDDQGCVDIWMNIWASPLSMGMADAFRVTDAYRLNGKWFHYQDGSEKELVEEYITHWMPVPAPPQERTK